MGGQFSKDSHLQCLAVASNPPRRAPPVLQLEADKAAAADKQSRVLDELAEARQRLKGLERELKGLGAQQKSLAAQKQVGRGGRGCASVWRGSVRRAGELRVACRPHASARPCPPCAAQELAQEREAAQRKKASAELDVADLEDKLANNQGGWLPCLCFCAHPACEVDSPLIARGDGVMAQLFSQARMPTSQRHARCATSISERAAVALSPLLMWGLSADTQCPRWMPAPALGHCRHAHALRNRPGAAGAADCCQGGRGPGGRRPPGGGTRAAGKPRAGPACAWQRLPRAC